MAQSDWSGSRLHDDATAAIQREKNLKRWLRAWKIALIERTNSGWSDLYDEIAN
jgi:putative endonuclease